MLNLDDIKPRMIEFTLGDKKYAIPSIDGLDADTAFDLIERGDNGRAENVALFKAVLDKHAPGARAKMKLVQMREILADWQKSGNAGESSTSSD